MWSKLLRSEGIGLVLGSAQIGMNYGIANTAGKPDRIIISSILDRAHKVGVRVLDTAQNYGSSEQEIGEYLRSHGDTSFHVISKMDPKLNPCDQPALVDSVRQSHMRIGSQLAGMLIHDAGWLKWWDNGLGAALRECVEKEYIGAFGVSVYEPDEMALTLSFEEIRLIQIPANVFDRRFLKTDLISEVLNSGRTLFVRSVFLQGLLVMPSAEAVRRIPESAPYLDRWHSLCRELDMEPGAVALRYIARSIPEGFIVVGCECPDQVALNRQWLSGDLPEYAVHEIESWPMLPTEVINPTKWKKV